MDLLTAFTGIATGMEEELNTLGFSLFYPDGCDKKSLPLVTENGRTTLTFNSDSASLRLLHGDNRLSLGYSDRPCVSGVDNDYSQLELLLLEPENTVDKDIRFIAGELSETLASKLGSGKKPVSSQSKLPQPISKAAAKSGAASYDANTLASRFTVIYPQFREEYKANLEKYGEFLPEDFFKRFGTPAVLETIKENNPVKMRKLFNLFNEIYDDGTNDIQGLIAVSILGCLENNDELLAHCVDYMSEDLSVAVIQVNRYLASSSAKGIIMRLENPPKYKPPKKKKPGLMERLTDAQAAQPR